MFEPVEAGYLGGGLVAGIDEAGRGPLAGPVSVGIASFDPEFFEAPVPPELEALDDSKNLKPAVREALYPAVLRHARFAAAVHVSSRLVDRLRIAAALEFAILRSLRRAELAGHAPLTALLDGNYKLPRVRQAFPWLDAHSIVKGDSRVLSIAAASIMAKVSRDRRMERYGKMFPGYGLEQHKGYGTAAHRIAIQERGPCPIHRRSYSW